MMKHTLKFEQLLKKTITDVSLWHDVLQHIIHCTGAKKGMIMLRDKYSAQLYIPNDLYAELKSPMLCGFSVDEIDDYLTHYYQQDPWTEIERQYHPVIPYAMSSYLPVEELRQTAFWHWLEPLQINDSAVVEIFSAPDSWISINLLFYCDINGKVKNACVEFLKEYQDLLGDYWKLGQQFRALAHAPESFRYFLEQQKSPSLLVDRQLNLLAMNQSAASFFRLNKYGIMIKNNILLVANKQKMAELKQKIVVVADRFAENNQMPEVQIELDELVLTCVLLGHGRDVVGLDTAVRFISIQPNNIRTKPSPYPIWETPGLTRREKELVEILATGGRVVDFMKKYHMAKSTSHTHWSHVKKKLKVKDRSEIVACHQRFLDRR
ncbi:hypothetical protein VA7868_02974 [Vibrio aerogenes CECT 7868]|uniref:HTH luxR-type domain-containing protein n=1 Tax=Vibrio aerogenes CECT 7868 TaxID=1216006 RepID=A0A1M5ZNP2_9VIBR|nr:helix-turn-helix transcriptional regulator [Vibrio aerogenes]SHI25739.1 hypothetical protein VA7868_02974 [Vibrio aerogenes CECT 7868]